MKSTFIILLTSFLLISCGGNKYEKELLGKWFEINETSKLEFKKDSLILSDLTLVKSKWKANENEISIIIKNEFNDSIKSNSLKYKLENDTLTIRTNENIEFDEFKFVKAENFTDFIFKKNNVNISLEKNEKSQYLPTENKNGVKIFIENQKGKIKIKSEYSENLNNLENDIEKLLLDLSPYIIYQLDDLRTDSDTDESTIGKWIKINSYYSLFIDKEIPDLKISLIVEKLRKSKIKRIYRIYETKDNKFVDFDKLKGIKL
ncbi:hypothetical protein KO506_12810 [Polaribacter vadi]|uniref:hypothetical protein n=1 Tax=Polaribacter TaxID=52959 RepID=UPI001C0A04B7|nr:MULTISPECIES: hypothetical protein [Polaribacter]MBU3012289.1 hypothetical protein [Polaribacter vadi]MDO6742106.1 hypothetical protein [Polaribacter sp. 1_MG-2023]